MKVEWQLEETSDVFAGSDGYICCSQTFYWTHIGQVCSLVISYGSHFIDDFDAICLTILISSCDALRNYIHLF